MAAIAVMLVVGACASGNVLKWNQVDAAAMMKSEAGKQAYNTIRFETFGPNAQQLFGYFLYKDGIEVDTGGGIPHERLGRKPWPRSWPITAVSRKRICTQPEAI